MPGLVVVYQPRCTMDALPRSVPKGQLFLNEPTPLSCGFLQLASWGRAPARVCHHGAGEFGGAAYPGRPQALPADKRVAVGRTKLVRESLGLRRLLLLPPRHREHY